MSTLRITNATRGSVLATCARAVEAGHSFFGFFCGFDGYFAPECNATFLKSSSPVDILFIDMLKGRIQKTVAGAADDAPASMRSDLNKNCRISSQIPATMCAVLELPAGVIAATGSAVGDVIVILSSSHCSAEELKKIGLLCRPHPA